MKISSSPSALFCQAALGFAALLAPFVPSTQGAPDVVDGVAALVNNDVITFSQVRELVGPRERSLRNNYTGDELVKKVRDARQGALNDLIDRQLILQEFKKKEFAIPSHMIDERIETIIREDFGGDRQAFVRTLQAQGFTMTKFREAERDKVIVQAMRYQNASPDFIVSPGKIDQLYVNQKPEYTTPEQIHLWMISIDKGSQVAKGEKDPQRDMAKEIREKLAKGAKFDEMARLYSQDSSRQSGGDWGWVDRKTLNETLTNAAFRLDVNKVSDVLDQGNSYYVLKVTERKSAYTKPIGEVRPELEKKLFSDERARKQDQWIAGLRAKAFIKTF